MENTKYPCGALLSPPDERDYRLAATAVEPEDKTFLLECPPVVDQGMLNNCVGQSGRYLVVEAFKKDFDVNWLYGRRGNDPYGHLGIGWYVRYCLDTMLKEGSAPKTATSKEELEMQAAYNWVEKNLTTLLGIAAPYKIDSYYKLTTLSDMKIALKKGHALIFSVGIELGDSVDEFGRYHARSAGRGYHALTGWGWDDIEGECMIRVQNSWGTSWGDGGRCWMWPLEILKWGDCWAAAIEPDDDVVDPQKEETVREEKVIGGVTTKLRVFGAPIGTASNIVGYLANNDEVYVLGYEGNRALVAQKPVVAGWINAAYLKDAPAVEKLDYTLNEYNDVVTVTEADYDKLIGARHTVRDFILRDDLGAQKISPTLIEVLESAEDHFGGTLVFPTTNSLFRTEASNKACNGASSSKHLKGYAADFRIKKADGSYVPRTELAKWAESYLYSKGYAGGIGVYSSSSEHIHLDLRGNWTFWWKVTSDSNTPGFGGRPVTFKQGHRSPAIAELQERLNSDGFSAGTADGAFGSKTTSALKAWQKANGLTADGLFGKGTNLKMKLFNW